MAEQPSEHPGVSRRALLRNTAIAGMGAGLVTLGGQSAAAADSIPAVGEDSGSWPKRRGKSMIGVPFKATPNPRFGIIGLGNRGGGMLTDLLGVPGAKVTALCDTRPEFAKKAAKVVTGAGQPEPAVHTNGEHAFEQLVARDDVDFVYVATPWEWHTPMALAAMRAGKHVGVECPIGITVKDLWELVDTSEQTGRHCIQLENCSYGQNEMRALRMVHAGKFGQVLHGSGAYLHDLRELLFSDTYYADEWRRTWHTKLNTDLYPTHGLGPVAAYLDIHRGDRLERISTMSTPALGLAEYREAHVPRDDSSWQETYVKGDVTMSLIQTAKGRVIHLVHGVSSPHPYSRLNYIAGTKGAFEDYPARIYVEPDHSGHQWGSWDAYKSFDHWLWTEVGGGDGGHGGMDYIMLWRLVQCLTLGLPPDIDVYDSAAWSAPLPLGVMSVKHKGAAIPFPDFTRNNWKTPHAGVDSPKPA
ncbi:Gfo/Idh/MocA family protein [Amycolatopsis sp. YIM 10]|uniref:Gfo/Idh/MocA family protein n=1 Tax=Amycolatopsis sp. YIM 10 TaxID=2653857 RepID=UPI0012908560|nr:Gfo/Idh/MocA family oxidoreductase [Amycolatopsis sp. YIM 10]QFU90021.1 Glycosyl hydrolase family 109 protein 1 precursor [Amycolatopsis sp. YIM 10]